MYQKELKQNMTKYFQYFSNESQEELASNKFGLIIDGKVSKIKPEQKCCPKI